MELTKRLTQLTTYIEPGMTVADVGTDHGYVPIYLVKNGISASVIAMDVNKGPLEKAKNNGTAYGVHQEVTYRLSDGLSALNKGEVDCILIAGMGGKLIQSILAADLEKSKSFQRMILSPHRDLEALRQWLDDKQFIVIEEDMLEEEGHFYPIIVIESTRRAIPFVDDKEFIAFMGTEGQDHINRLYWRYGKYLLLKKHPVLKKSVSKEISAKEKLQKELIAKGVKERIKELNADLIDGKKVLAWLESK